MKKIFLPLVLNLLLLPVSVFALPQVDLASRQNYWVSGDSTDGQKLD